MSYKTPTNKEEYWKLISDNWNDISYFLNIFLPTYQKIWIDKTRLNEPMIEYLERLKDERNSKLIRAVSAAHHLMTETFEEDNYEIVRIINILCYDECFLYEEKEISF